MNFKITLLGTGEVGGGLGGLGWGQGPAAQISFIEKVNKS